MILPRGRQLEPSELRLVEGIAAEHGAGVVRLDGDARSIYVLKGEDPPEELRLRIEALPFVESVARNRHPYRLMQKESPLGKTSVRVGDVRLGAGFSVIAGPCTVDPKEPQLFLETAQAAKEAGAVVLRGGVWKPRTNPHSFQGDDRSLRILLDARRLTGLPVNTEVMDEHQLALAVEAKVDMIQIGARNALNYALLRHVAEATAGKGIAVILKRSIHMGPVDEFLCAAEYLAAGGNPEIALSPRGTVPTMEGFRYHPDESVTLLLKKKTWAPVIVDPSHSVGAAAMVPHAALAAAAYGADGILVECHVDPARGIGDDPKQAVTPKTLARLVEESKRVSALAKAW